MNWLAVGLLASGGVCAARSLARYPFVTSTTKLPLLYHRGRHIGRHIGGRGGGLVHRIAHASSSLADVVEAFGLTGRAMLVVAARLRERGAADGDDDELDEPPVLRFLRFLVGVESRLLASADGGSPSAPPTVLLGPLLVEVEVEVEVGTDCCCW